MAKPLTYAELSALSDAELMDMNHTIVAIINGRRKMLVRQQGRHFHTGMKVSFPLKSGATVVAEIDRVNQKTATCTKIDPNTGVRFPHHQWRVPFSMLRPAAA